MSPTLGDAGAFRIAGCCSLRCGVLGQLVPFMCEMLSKTSNDILCSLSSELLVASMDVSRCILVLDTSISATSNLEQREYLISMR